MIEKSTTDTEKHKNTQKTNVFDNLTVDQMRYVIARLDHPNKKDAAEEIGITPQVVYRWPDTVDEAVRIMQSDIVAGALAMRKRSLAKAMAVKVAGLDNESDAVSQKAATEIIEWETGKAQQKIDHTSDGEKIGVVGLGIDTDQV